MVLKGNTALITGGSSGIGRATAIAMARAGARVAISFHKNERGAEETVGSIRAEGGDSFAMRADATQINDVQALVEGVRSHFGPITVLVNNAGDLIERRTIGDMTEQYWDQLVDLNLKSVFLCVKFVWEEMVATRQGAILNVSSIAGHNGGGPGAGAYSAAKGGLLTYTKALARELGPHGVRVNGVAPGVILTAYHKRYTSPDSLRRFVESIPLGRAGTPDEVADVLVFLASPAARYITGETIEVNGGMLMD